MNTRLLLRLLAVAAIFAGCTVSSKDIESWKKTQKGPDKLTAVLLDERYTPAIRAEAAAALEEIGQWDNHDKAFEAIEPASRVKVVDALVPLLLQKIKEGNQPPSPPTATQVAAKDGLFVALKYAEGNSKQQIEQTLTQWCVEDFNNRFFAGRYSIEVVLLGIGAPASKGLIDTLKPDFIAYDKVTEILSKVGSPEDKEKAGKNLVEIAVSRSGKVEEALLVALGRMGGKDVREFLLATGADFDAPARVQRGALMSYLQFNLCNKEDLEALFKIADDIKQDYMARNLAYDAIVCVGDKTAIPRFFKLLHELGDDKDSFRGVGVDEIMKLGGPDAIPDVIREIAAEKDPWEKFENLRDFVMVRFTQDNEGKTLGPGDLKKVQENVRPFVTAKETIARAIAIFTLGIVGEPSDIALLKKLQTDGSKLNEWKSKEGEMIGEGGKIVRVEAMNFEKVGDVAKWAIAKIEKKSATEGK